MPVKYFSSAGILVTYWCNAQCESCYLNCRGQCDESMSVESAVDYWAQLIDASPHGCRVHLTGGEPFGNFRHLLEICSLAKSRRLGPLDKVETNAFWAADEAIIRDRLTRLDHAGMHKLVISTDPYHQQFVPIDYCRTLAATAERILSPQRVQVRWRDWLDEGFDTDNISRSRRDELFAQYAQRRRDRFTGRAAGTLAQYVEQTNIEDLADNPCSEPLLRSRHVHVDPAGRVFPGTCAGIILGNLAQQSVTDLWQKLNDDYNDRPILAPLVRGGPVALLDRASDVGFVPQKTYAGKCHLCWDIRQYLAGKNLEPTELGPAWMYQSLPNYP